MPLLVIIIISVRIFVKRKSILKALLELLNEMEEGNAEIGTYFDETCMFLRKVANLIFFSTISFSLIFTASGTLLHKLNFPMYIPEFLKGRKEVFYIYWLFEVIFCYSLFHKFKCL
jgi:hypothetical protein